MALGVFLLVFFNLSEMRLLNGVRIVQNDVFGSLKNSKCDMLLLYLKGL